MTTTEIKRIVDPKKTTAAHPRARERRWPSADPRWAADAVRAGPKHGPLKAPRDALNRPRIITKAASHLNHPKAPLPKANPAVNMRAKQLPPRLRERPQPVTIRPS